MNAKQTKLIEQAATVETDGEGWRKRMEAWLVIPFEIKFQWTTTFLKPKRLSRQAQLRMNRRLDIAMLNAVLGKSFR